MLVATFSTARISNADPLIDSDVECPSGSGRIDPMRACSKVGRMIRGRARPRTSHHGPDPWSNEAQPAGERARQDYKCLKCLKAATSEPIYDI